MKYDLDKALLREVFNKEVPPDNLFSEVKNYFNEEIDFEAIDDDEGDALYFPNIYDEVERVMQDDCSSEILNNCCGVSEGSVSELKDLPKKEVAFEIARRILINRVTSTILTQAYVRRNPLIKGTEAILSEFVPPKYLGQSPKTGNHIFMWIITREDLYNYYKNLEQNEKKTKRV